MNWNISFFELLFVSTEQLQPRVIDVWRSVQAGNLTRSYAEVDSWVWFSPVRGTPSILGRVRFICNWNRHVVIPFRVVVFRALLQTLLVSLLSESRVLYPFTFQLMMTSPRSLPPVHHCHAAKRKDLQCSFAVECCKQFMLMNKK